jgi:hypothetical protein
MLARTKGAAGAAILGAVLIGCCVAPAVAQDRRDDRRAERFEQRREDRARRERWNYDHRWNGGYYAPPPVVYGPRGYYPPPVVYGPGVGLALPGLGITIQ